MKGFVYIMTNKQERILQHLNKRHPQSFSARYSICKLVYFECLETIGEAIRREKQIKAGSRKRKIELIVGMNPRWNDLSLILDGNQGLLRPPASDSQ